MHNNSQITQPNEWTIIWIAGIGMFLSTLDSGIINVALPYLQQQFQVSTNIISLTISLYFIALAATIIFFGKLSDYYGRVKIFSIGLIIFAISSLGCGLAMNVVFLIISRALQGIGAAMLQSTSAALITTLLPPDRRALGLGTLGIFIGAGPILGPLICGLLLSILDWRWIFWINIPLCLLTFWNCIALDDRTSLSKFPVSILKILSPLFHSIQFIKLLFSTLVFGMVTAVILVLPPYILLKIMHFTPLKIGLISFSAPLGLVITARISGKYINQMGSNRLMLTGLILMSFSLGGLAILQSQINTFLLALFLLVYGIGGGLFQPANIFAVMDVVSNQQQGMIGSVNRMIHNLGNALGVIITASLLHAHDEIIELFNVFQHVWIFALSLVAISLLSFILI